MTAPSNPGDASPELANANRNVEPAVTESNAQSGDRYVVKTPSLSGVLRAANGEFPDVTPKGTEMSAGERDAAKKAAKACRLKLSTSKVGS